MKLIVSDNAAKFVSDGDFRDSNNENTIIIPDLVPAFYMLINPNFYIPESYCRGHLKIISGDLADIIKMSLDGANPLMVRYMAFVQNKYSFSYILKQKIATLYYSRQVRSHYDINPDIYRLFLDDELVYTCALFENGDTLEAAQQRKYQTVFDRINGDGACNILNIGCGWGSFERFAVKNNKNLSVTGLSISKEQLKYATSKSKNYLDQRDFERIRFIYGDYIEHNAEKDYDAVTAIGMVEHVGLSGYEDFLKKTYALLKKNGLLLIHMIVKAKSEIPTNSWIDKFIFPGGYCPSISEITRAAEKTNFRISGIYIHSPINYATTLRKWRENLYKNKNKMINIYTSSGYSLDHANYLFRRWEFYLAGSEASFRVSESPLQIAHFVFEKY